MKKNFKITPCVGETSSIVYLPINDAHFRLGWID